MTRGARAATPRAAVLALALLLAGLVLPAGLAAPAAALPPDGAGADTPGTSASVSPASLAPGATLSFTLSGFPAGETVYVKIDDGVGYGDTAVQGSGVIHQQAIPSSGTVSGSFTLPAGITAGAHWLRFLASAELYAADGSYLGVEGYTHRGGADFTVVVPSSGGTGGGSGSGTGAASGGGTSGGTGGTSAAAGGTGSGTTGGSGADETGTVVAGTTSGSGATAVTGQGGVVQAQPTAEATAEPTATAPTAAAGAAGPTASPAAHDVSADAPVVAAAGVPVTGLVVGGLLVLAGAAFVATVLARRRGAAPSTASSAGPSGDPSGPSAPTAGR